MAVVFLAESLLAGVKPPFPEYFKGLMDGKTILKFIH